MDNKVKLTKDQIRVELLSNTDLAIAEIAINTCWDKTHTSEPGVVNTAKIDRIANKFKHESTIEHLSYTFYITNISRAVLHELVRHRMANYSVKSTRHTLKELLYEAPFISTTGGELVHYERAEKYLVYTGIPEVDYGSVMALERLRVAVAHGTVIDRVKYMLPEAYKTSLISTMNMRGFQNFLELRTSTAALPEIRELAWSMYYSIPTNQHFMYKHIREGRENDRTS